MDLGGCQKLMLFAFSWRIIVYSLSQQSTSLELGISLSLSLILSLSPHPLSPHSHFPLTLTLPHSHFPPPPLNIIIYIHILGDNNFEIIWNNSNSTCFTLLCMYSTDMKYMYHRHWYSYDTCILYIYKETTQTGHDGRPAQHHYRLISRQDNYHGLSLMSYDSWCPCPISMPLPRSVDLLLISTFSMISLSLSRLIKVLCSCIPLRVSLIIWTVVSDVLSVVFKPTLVRRLW